MWANMLINILYILCMRILQISLARKMILVLRNFIVVIWWILEHNITDYNLVHYENVNVFSLFF